MHGHYPILRGAIRIEPAGGSFSGSQLADQ